MDAHTHTRHLTRESSRVCLWNKPVKMFRRSISVGINFITVWRSRLHCGWPGKKLLIHRETFSHEIVLYKLKTSLFHVQRFLLITNSTFKKKKKNFTGHIKQTGHENEKEELPASKMHASDTRAKIPLYIFRTIWG